jgi:hypothetical protein
MKAPFIVHTHMGISNYSLTRFILDVSFCDHQASSTDPDWKAWFHSVSRIFSHRNIPLSVLEGLLAKNVPQLSTLCEAEITKRIEKNRRAELQAEHRNEKYERWIQRRDAGNARVQELRKKKQEIDEQKVQEIQRQMNESYVKQLFPVWKQRMDEIVQQRNNEMSTVWATTKPFPFHVSS